MHDDDPPSTPPRGSEQAEGQGSYTARPSREVPEDGPTRDEDREAVERSGSPEGGHPQDGRDRDNA